MGRRTLSALTLVAAFASCGVTATTASATSSVATAWGANDYGQLGDGLQAYAGHSDVPAAVSGLSEVVAVSAGGEHSLALLENGTVMAWGSNSYGQLGDGHEGYEGHSDVPVPVSGLSEVAEVSAGYEYSLALLKNGTVMAWGANEYGKLGDGREGYEGRSNVPVAVTGLKEVAAVSAGGDHSLAVLKNGTVMAWGANGDGQLGDGREGYAGHSDVPVKVTGLSEAVAVAAGAKYDLTGDGEHSLALLKNGTVMSWGSNFRGELGDGREGYEARSNVPVAVSGLTEVAQIAAGKEYSLALRKSGQVEEWGKVSVFAPHSNVPVGIGPTDAIAISGGAEHALELLGSGSLVAWGDNNYGDLGDGTSAERTYPVAVRECGSASASLGIAAGGTQSIAFGPPRTLCPGLSDVEPNHGPGVGGTTVTIDGTELEDATAVNFGSTSAASFTVNSPNSITAVSPTGAGTAGVTVTTPTATTVVAEEDIFNFEVDPNINNISPAHGPGAGGTTVTITGKNLGAVTAVSFGTSAAASFTVHSATWITAVSPPGSGTVDITATNSEGTSKTGGFDHFNYEVGPVVTSVFPRTGRQAGGASVTISGSNLAAVTSVRFGEAAAVQFTVESATTITAVSPPGTGTVDITLTNPEATSPTVEADRFTYVEGPPEFGVCVKVPRRTGKYGNLGCTSKGGSGAFEWHPGPGPEPHFTLKSLKPLAIERFGLVCKVNSGAGEVTGARTVGNIAITLTSCAALGAACTSAGGGLKAGEVRLQGYSGVPGVIKLGGSPLEDTVGVTLEGESSIECGPFAFQLRGAAIGSIAQPNAMRTSLTWTFTIAAEARQSPERFDGGGPQSWELSFNGSFEAEAVSVPLTLTSTQKFELNTVA